MAAILVAALCLRLIFAVHVAPSSVYASIDAQGYRILALNLVEQGVLSLRTEPPYVPDGLRTPLYPAFLALLLVTTRDAPLAVPVAQALVDTGTAALVFCLGCRLAGRRRGLIAALLYALNPVSFLFVGEAMTEVLLAFLATGTFCTYLHALAVAERRHLLLAATGLLAGLCILCKPHALLLPFLLALGWIIERRRVRLRAWMEGAALAAVAMLTLLPWLSRNQLLFGRPFLSLAFESNQAHVSAVAAILQSRGEVAAAWTARWEEVYMQSVVAPAARAGGWTEAQLPRDAAEAARRSADLVTTARSIVRQNRMAYLAAHLKGAARSLVPELHRYWHAALLDEPWPVSDALSDLLGRALRERDWQPASSWWSGQTAGQRAMWLASMIVSAIGFFFLLSGLWALRRSPGVLLSIALFLLVLVLMPGPIGYVRFWMPGVPLAAAVMACGATRRGLAERVRSTPACATILPAR
ncbi:MAG TPA: glycosyltransferase family 39 protein [Anaerolineae bacterium]|nr:glycosyltransferase family 39 protein [Anaerolineae bacterium]